jgi:hypothetical protein
MRALQSWELSRATEPEGVHGTESTPLSSFLLLPPPWAAHGAAAAAVEEAAAAGWGGSETEEARPGTPGGASAVGACLGDTAELLAARRPVPATSAGAAVSAAPTGEPVYPATALQRVVVILSLEAVVASAPGDVVLALAGTDAVGPALALDAVGAPRDRCLGLRGSRHGGRQRGLGRPGPVLHHPRRPARPRRLTLRLLGESGRSYRTPDV